MILAKRKKTGGSSTHRLPQTARIAVVVVGCCTCLVANCLLSVASGRVALPNTAAGRSASAYFEAFNSGSSKRMQTFQEAYRATSYLEKNPLDQRLARYERLRGIFGKLTPLRSALSLEFQLTLLVDATDTDDVLVMRFQLEDEPPHRLNSVRFSGIDHSEVPNDYVLYVADRAQPLDSTLAEETVHSVAKILRENYVDPDLGSALADTLLTRLSNRTYTEARKTGQLADLLTDDIVAVSRDVHLWVAATNPMYPQSTYPENRPVEELRQENYHFRKVEILSGNVGYLKFDMIHDDQEAQDIASDALASVEGCDALIFDLTDNIGGEWGSGRLILSYLFPENTTLSRSYDRSGRLVSTNTTLTELPGKRFDPEVHVYVLTSNRTGSAAEAFAFALQQSGRGTVIGQTTCGAGYRCDELPVNKYFLLSVSTLRVVSAFTDSSFQGVGVIPDRRVAEEDAIAAALEDAVKRIKSTR